MHAKNFILIIRQINYEEEKQLKINISDEQPGIFQGKGGFFE